ncbi:MAG: SDR family oxidoreductase [Candidatus Marinimicrobia bacterium]|nr:SDR family oxidoreductase [Candidatus Neomarinimicrobiota bacterium]
MDLGLNNKRVLITGASRGIGASIAENFLTEGASVIIVSRGSEQLFVTESYLKNSFKESEVYAESCDCTNVNSLEKLRGRIKERWGGLDIVVANIGDGRSVSEPLPDNEQWKRTWDNNFESALHTARTFLPMLQKSKGCLLFISSIASMEAFGAPVDYSTAKTAVAALAKNMSRKLANEVRVNVIAPGNIIFDGSSWDIKNKKSPNAVAEVIKSTVPMNRFGLPNEIADSAVFLCSKRASFITGATLVVDGGQTVGIF